MRTANLAIPIIQNWYHFWPPESLGTGRCFGCRGAGGPADKLHAKRSRDSHTRINDREDWVLDKNDSAPSSSNGQGVASALTTGVLKYLRRLQATILILPEPYQNCVLQSMAEFWQISDISNKTQLYGVCPLTV